MKGAGHTKQRLVGGHGEEAGAGGGAMTPDGQTAPEYTYGKVQVRACLTESVYKVVLRKSIPAQIRQLTLHYC